MGTPLEEKQFTYLLEAYKAAVAYFDGYSGRVTTRFNILFAVDVALAGALGATLSSDSERAASLDWIICILGLALSTLLYIQSAQDKYLIRRHLHRINVIRKQIEEAIHLESDKIPALFSPMDATDSQQKHIIYENFTSWRSNSISLTRVPVYTAILLIIVWLAALFMVLFL